MPLAGIFRVGANARYKADGEDRPVNVHIERIHSEL